MSPGARTQGAVRLRHGASESPAHEYLKLYNSGAQGYDATRAIVRI